VQQLALSRKDIRQSEKVPPGALTEVDRNTAQNDHDTDHDSGVESFSTYSSSNDSTTTQMTRSRSQPISYKGADSCLQDELNEAITDTCKNLHRPLGFVPRHQLCAIMSETAVAGELEKIDKSFLKRTKKLLKLRNPSVNPEKLKRKARRILGGGDPECKEASGRNTKDSGGKCFRKVFAILVLIERPGMIGRFVGEGVCDDDLPFQLTGSWPYRMCRRDNGGCRLKCFMGWRESTLRRFMWEQWKVLVPVFMRSFKLDDPPVLEKEIILPFTEKDYRNTGAYGKVFRVRIHPEHCKFKGQVSESSVIYNPREDSDLDTDTPFLVGSTLQ